MASQPHSGSASSGRKVPARFLAVGLALVLLIIVTLILLVSNGTGDQATIDERTDTPPGPPATKTSSTGVLESGGTRLLPIPPGALVDSVGKDVRGRAVPVQLTRSGQGLWVGNSDAQRVWVAYDGKAPEIGRRVDLEGTVRAVPDRPGKAFQLPTDDLAQIKEQRGYIEAKTVKQVGEPIGRVPKGP
jgi:hypothetical protein